MLAALAFASTLLGQGSTTVELFRGAKLASDAVRYWSASDTFLDSRHPDASNGGSHILIGGPNNTVLIRFGDLTRAVGRHRKVVKASLVLTPSSSDKPVLQSISEVLTPWGEGPAITLSGGLIRKLNKAGSLAPQWSATWKERHVGGESPAWQEPGARGPIDAKPIPDAKLSLNSENVVIDGLEGAVQRMVDRPFDDHGFAIIFKGPAELYSSESDRARPRLVLELADGPATSGPDLSVTYIERTPETSPTAPKKWPANGDELTYTAHVKNVGDQPAKGFIGQWVTKERAGSTFESTKSLAPGEETTVTTKAAFRWDPDDHRIQPIALRIIPQGSDGSALNDFREVQAAGLSLKVTADQALVDSFKAGAHEPFHSFEDWTQYQVGLLNDVYFPYSRFSFAPDGVLERLRIQSIGIDSAATPDRGNCDAAIHFSGPIAGAPWAIDSVILRQLGRAVGLTDLDAQQVTPDIAPTGIHLTMKDGGQPITRYSMDYFAGLMGGGDTRFEGMLPREFVLAAEPVYSRILDQTPLEATDLLSCTEAGRLTAHLSRRVGELTADVYDLPTVDFVHAKYLNGDPLPNAQLDFYQSANGVIGDGAPTFSLKTNASGSALLPFRDPGPSGRSNPFGALAPDGSNGVFLVKATANGTTDWGYLKVWQFWDFYRRGNVAAGFFDMPFNLPSAPLDLTINLAKGKTVTDSKGGSPASLVDESGGGAVQLAGGPGDWVEVDLGRDHTIGEIRLYSPDPQFWSDFEIRVYTTGQKPTEAGLWAKEPNFGWAFANRSMTDAGRKYVSYRSVSDRIRFIRIINHSPTSSAHLSQIKVFGVQ